MVTKRSSMVKEMDTTYKQQLEMEMETQSRKRRGLIRRLTLLGILSLSLFCIAFVTIYAQANTIEEKEQKRVALQNQLETLELEQENLEQEIENYNNLEYIAEIARRDYYLSKPGETLFKLPE
ncbi:septum formation initiator family protein [Halalkalibacter urbisdiaboli]|uniref:septum formation initiator family protein n=1 Tax=Halalkalibacter urbisdiaboli TaxID=1960589 RepID=UPI000B453790|nr:septum formation initiator family protein [Halalkalibacter urbisdiaboli]